MADLIPKYLDPQCVKVMIMYGLMKTFRYNKYSLLNDGDNWPFIAPLIILGEPGLRDLQRIQWKREIKSKQCNNVCNFRQKKPVFAALFIVIVNAGCLWGSARNNRALEGEI